MATKWYFTDTTESGSYTEKSTDTANKTETNAGNLKQMLPTKGAGLVSPSITNTTTSAEKWFFRAFVSPPLLAQTVSAGTVTFRCAPIESNSSLNHALKWYCYLLRGGSNVLTIAGPADEATESATSSTGAGREHAVSYSSFSPQAGDQIVVEVWSGGTSAMTTGYTHQPKYGGAAEITEGADNSDPASNVEFSTTVNISNAAQGSASGTCTATAAATVHKPVEFGSIGTLATGTTSLSVPFPSGIASGDLLVLAVANKYPTNGPSTPSGWTLITNGQKQGGSGPSAADSGQVYATVFYKVASGSESGSETVTVTSGNSSSGRMIRYVRNTGSSWALAAANGDEPTVGGSWSVTLGSDPGITTNDLLLAVVASNSDRIDFSAPAVTATSATIGSATERTQSKVADGDDHTLYVNEFLCTAGTSSAAPVYVHTNGSNAADDPCGAIVLLRMRASSGTAHAAQGSASGTCTATGNTTVAFKAAGAASGNATVSGSATVAYKAAGSASGTVTATGAAGLQLPAQGSASGTVTASGTAQIFKLVSGAASGTVTATANATATYAAAGSASGTTTATGSATVSLAAQGSASGTVTATASATVGKFVSGSASGTVTAVGAANVNHPIVGSASGTVSASGTAHTTLSASSLASGTVTATATAAVTRGVPGSASCTATVSAVPSLLLGARGYASGTVTATGSATLDSTSFSFTLDPTTAIEIVAVVCTLDDAADTDTSLGAASSVVATMLEAPRVTTSAAGDPFTVTTAIEVPS